jgi:hypothetical protein
MGERKNVSTRRRGEKKAVLGPGVHPAKVELHAGTTATVRLLAGDRLTVEIAPEVEPAFVAECLREGRTVLLAQTETGPTLVGALQTTRAVGHDVDGVLEIDAREIRMYAGRGFSLEVGSSAVRAEPNGTLRLEGERLTVDVGSLVRFLSARVELP